MRSKRRSTPLLEPPRSHRRSALHRHGGVRSSCEGLWHPDGPALSPLLSTCQRVFPSDQGVDRSAPRRSYAAIAGGARSSAPMELGAVNAGASNTQGRAFAA